jgi:NAD(P)-dependent dehydrogenase (short-subunit alcohol dehydrogenase family)
MKGDPRMADASLAGKTAIVTGAGSGLGRAMARALAQAGANVAGVDVNAASLATLRDELAPLGEKSFLPVTGDVSSMAGAQAIMDLTKAAFGDAHVLVNNAGIIMARMAPEYAEPPFWEADPETWQRVMAVNAMGAFFLARLAVVPMLARKWGRIINVTTNFHSMLSAGRSAYGPSKSALEASSAIWAKQLDGTGVTVNVLIPGGITATGMVPPRTPNDNMRSPDIMMAPVRWLASEASDGISGFRFIADEWDETVPPEAAAVKARSPVAWADYATASAKRQQPKV